MTLKQWKVIILTQINVLFIQEMLCIKLIWIFPKWCNWRENDLYCTQSINDTKTNSISLSWVIIKELQILYISKFQQLSVYNFLTFSLCSDRCPKWDQIRIIASVCRRRLLWCNPICSNSTGLHTQGLQSFHGVPAFHYDFASYK